jgi:hypothetical protein
LNTPPIWESKLPPLTCGTMAEEMPHAYKDVADVMETMDHAGISKRVARLRPVRVIKGQRSSKITGHVVDRCLCPFTGETIRAP